MENINYNYKQHNYLINLELINKYSLKNIHEIPSIDKISVNFPSKNFLGSDEAFFGYEIQSIFLFYSIFSLISFVNLKKKKFLEKDTTKVDFDCFLKIVLSNKKEFYKFLFDIIDPNVMSLVENISTVNSQKKTLKSNSNHNYYNVPLKYFGDFTKLLTQLNIDLNVNQFNLNVDIVIKNKKNRHSSNLLDFFRLCSFCG
jgi:ribosomal protein L5